MSEVIRPPFYNDGGFYNTGAGGGGGNNWFNNGSFLVHSDSGYINYDSAQDRMYSVNGRFGFIIKETFNWADVSKIEVSLNAAISNVFVTYPVYPISIRGVNDSNSYLSRIARISLSGHSATPSNAVSMIYANSAGNDWVSNTRSGIPYNMVEQQYKIIVEKETNNVKLTFTTPGAGGAPQTFTYNTEYNIIASTFRVVLCCTNFTDFGYMLPKDSYIKTEHTYLKINDELKFGNE